MIQVRILSLSVDSVTNQPVVILTPLDDEAAEGSEGRTVLPIWIGYNEASAILLELRDIEPPRPLTHDLLEDVIGALGYLVQRVEITRLEEGTFFAALVLRGEEHTIAVDARPSDSIALAVRAGCPIFVAEEVLEEAAVLLQTSEDEPAEEEEIERFREFLEHVDPSDFLS